MTAERRTRITIETERILILARRQSIRGWCEGCGREVEFVRQDQAAPTLEAVPRRLSQEKLHLQKAKDGLVVCLKSVARFLKAASGHNTSQ